MARHNAGCAAADIRDASISGLYGDADEYRLVAFDADYYAIRAL